MNLEGYDHKRFFENGYGISIIWKPNISYGWKRGLFEIAVLKGTEEDWSLCYDTNITNDVVGHLDFDEVTKYIQKVKELKDEKNLRS